MTELFKDQDFDLANPSNNLAKTAASIKWLRPKVRAKIIFFKDNNLSNFLLFRR